MSVMLILGVFKEVIQKIRIIKMGYSNYDEQRSYSLIIVDRYEEMYFVIFVGRLFSQLIFLTIDPSGHY